MRHSIQLTTTIPSVTALISRSPLWRGFLFVSLGLAVVWLALSPTAQAVTPAPDGGYPNQNTAEGEDALFSLTNVGFGNTAVGFQALFSNTDGGGNTANGDQALYNNTIANFNTASGGFALFNNTTGSYNAATGYAALYGNTTGQNNTANGYAALTSNTTGESNTANGFNALFSNTTGKGNIALGASAGANLTTGSNNIDIGNAGAAGQSNQIRIGTKGTQTATFIAGISGVGVTGSQVLVNSNGKLGVMTSSARFKKAIKAMDKASEAILALKPVTFRYNQELDPDQIPQFGLVAEQVEKISPDLVARDEEGKAYTVRYEAVNAMLLNEFLKEHRKVEELEATVAKLQSAFKEQASRIQKMTRLRRVEVNRSSAPQMAANDQ